MSLCRPGFEFGALVHASVRQDAAQAARHRQFIAAHATAGFAALCVLPVYLALFGPPTALEALGFAALAAPIAVAFLLSRTGCYRVAHMLSAAILAGLMALGASLTGGLSSFLLAFFAVIPLEAALSGSRRLLAAGLAMALAGLAVTGIAAAMMTAPAPESWLNLAGSAVLCMVTALLAGTLMTETPMGANGDRPGRDATLPAASASALPVLLSRHGPNGTLLEAAGALAEDGVAGALAGDGFFERVHIADRPAFLSAIRRAAHGGEAVGAAFRMRLQGGQGGFEPVEMLCRAAGDQPIGMTEDTRRGREVLALTRRTGRAAAPGGHYEGAPEAAVPGGEARPVPDVFAGMDHELRTPLNAIVGFAGLMQHQPDLAPERVRDYSGLVRESGLALLRMVNDLLMLASLRADRHGVPEPFDLASLLRACAEETAPAFAHAQVAFDADMAGAMPALALDRRACAAILRNAVLATLYHCPAGARVRLQVRREDDAARIRLSMDADGPARRDEPDVPAPVQALDTMRAGEGASAFSMPLALALAQSVGVDLVAGNPHAGGVCCDLRIPFAPGAGRTVAPRADRDMPADLRMTA